MVPVKKSETSVRENLKLCYSVITYSIILSSYKNCTSVHNFERITCHSESFVDSSAILLPEINVDEIYAIYSRHHEISLNPSPSPEMGYFGSIISSSRLVGIRDDVTLLVKPICLQLKPGDSKSPLTRTKSNFPWISPFFSVTFTRITELNFVCLDQNLPP